MKPSKAPPAPRSSPSRALRILLVDSDFEAVASAREALTRAGYEVLSVMTGGDAMTVLRADHADTIIVDAVAPDVGGIELLRQVRELHDELPVILLASTPTVESAMAAARHRATDYLMKPVAAADLVASVKRGLERDRLAGLRREATKLGPRVRFTSELRREDVLLAIRFDRALAVLYMVYQPIVSWSRRTVFGYEALVRSPDTSLPHPGAIFEAAERLHRVADVSRRIRTICVDPLPTASSDAALFVNLHASDLLDEALLDPSSALAQHASRVVLEITERSALDDVREVSARVAQLRKAGFRVAVDDIGAGYSSLNSLATLAPDLVKLDVALVRDIDQDPTRQRVVRSLTTLCHELGITVIAECVETAAERDALVGFGIDLFQGYLFARPGPPFPEPVF